jgi:hypothetical protein
MDQLEMSQEALVVRPGDTLIVRCSRPLNMYQADQLKAKLAQRLPGIDVLILSSPVDQIAAYRPNEAPAG